MVRPCIPPCTPQAAAVNAFIHVAVALAGTTATAPAYLAQLSDIARRLTRHSPPPGQYIVATQQPNYREAK